MSPSVIGGLLVGIALGFLVGKFHTIASRTFRDYRGASALAKGVRKRRWTDLRNAVAVWAGVGMILAVAAFGWSTR